MNKLLFLFLIVFGFSCNYSKAQQKNNSTLVGFNVGVKATQHYSLPKYKIGLPSFSYSSSIEKRFSINNHLRFSLQYAVNYFKYTQLNTSGLIVNNKVIAHSLSTQANVRISKKINAFTGIGMQKNIVERKTYNQTKELILLKAENKFTIADFNNFNPYFIIGIENSIHLFNTNLYYSLQYNLGFKNLNSRLIPIAENASGFSIGLKYKY